MEFKDYADRELLVLAVADRIASDLRQHLDHNERAAIALAGGTTPGPIFDDLCAVDLDWDRVNVMATDERWVPTDHDRSNAKLIRERLLVEMASKAKFEPFYRESLEPEAAAKAVSVVVDATCPLAVVLLGMGEDMHTASLFPGTDGLQDALSADAPALVVQRPQSQPEPRISLSAQLLNGAINKHLVIFGESKRIAFERALGLSAAEAPIKAVLTEATVHWAP